MNRARAGAHHTCAVLQVRTGFRASTPRCTRAGLRTQYSVQRRIKLTTNTNIYNNIPFLHLLVFAIHDGSYLFDRLHFYETLVHLTAFIMGSQEDTPAADYIIVGGGTAGLVVANRLSEDPSVRVLVLESGKNQLDNPMVNIPAMFPALHGSECDFQYHTVPQVRITSAAQSNNVTKYTELSSQP